MRRSSRTAAAIAILATTACASMPRGEALETERNASIAEFEGQLALGHGEWAGGIEPLQRGIEIAPHSARVVIRRRSLALALVNLGRCDEAMRWAAGASLDYVKARCLGAAGKWREAIDAAQWYTSAAPEDAEGRWILADLLQAEQGAFNASDVMERALARSHGMIVGARLDSYWSGIPDRQWVALPTDTHPRCMAGAPPMRPQIRAELQKLLDRGAQHDASAWIIGYYRACLSFDAASADPDVQGRVRAIEAGLTTVDALRSADPKQPDLLALDKAWRPKLDEIERIEEAKASFERLVVIHRTEIEKAAAVEEARHFRKQRKADPVRLTIPARAVNVVKDAGERCAFQVEDPADSDPDSVPRYVVAEFACPWGNDGPDDDLDLFAIPTKTVNRMTSKSLGAPVLQMEAVVLRHRDVVRERRMRGGNR